MTDVKVIITDGKMHSVDSKDIDLQSAAGQAVKCALEKRARSYSNQWRK